MDPENPCLEMAKAAAEGAGKESVNTLANTIHDMFPFWGLKRKAVDIYVKEIKDSNLPPDAKMLAIANTKETFRELKNQTAILDVAYSVVSSKHGENFSPDPDADPELIYRLLDAGKYVSDEDIQLMWGNVLAGELENPGSTPKNMVRILSELSKDYATVFSNLCSLQVDILEDNGDEISLCGQRLFVDIYDLKPYLRNLSIKTDTLDEMENIGLIDIFTNGYVLRTDNSSPLKNTCFHLVSGTDVLTVSDTNLRVGSVTLTDAGKCIARFIPRVHNPEHFAAIRDYLTSSKHVILPTPGIRIILEDDLEGLDGYRYQRLPIEPQASS